MRVLYTEQANHCSLDLKDLKILYILEKNSRKPLSFISKKIGLSRDSVAYRITNLLSHQVISNFPTIIDIQKFNLSAFHIFIRLRKTDERSEKDFVKRFVSYPWTRAVIKCHGSYDYEIALIAEDIIHIDKILKRMMDDNKDQLSEYIILFSIRTLHSSAFPTNFFKKIPAKDKKMLDTNFDADKKTQSSFELDSKDHRILKLISDNARISLVESAQQTDLSPDTITYRLKRLNSSGFIRKYTVGINYATLGYTMFIVLFDFKIMTTEKEQSLQTFFEKDNNTIFALKTLGKYDLIVYFCTRSTEELHQSIDHLREYFGEDLKGYEILIGYKEFKYTYYPDYLLKKQIFF